MDPPSQQQQTVSPPRTTADSQTPSLTPSGNPKDPEDPATSKVKDGPKKEWSRQMEVVLQMWADIAVCYRWMHDRSFRKHKKVNYAFSIPVIVLSTLTGTANFGLSSFVPAQYMSYGQIAVGMTSIFAGVLSTLQNFFRYAQSSEAHFIASQGWSKLHRAISVELLLEVSNRRRPDEFMRACRADFDRLMENSPIIPMNVIQEFMKTFRTIPELVMPDVCDKIKHTLIFREPGVDASTVTEHILQQVEREVGTMMTPERALSPIRTPPPGPAGVGAFMGPTGHAGHYASFSVPHRGNTHTMVRRTDSAPAAQRFGRTEVETEAPAPVGDLIRRFNQDPTLTMRFSRPLQHANTMPPLRFETASSLESIAIDPIPDDAESLRSHRSNPNVLVIQKR